MIVISLKEGFKTDGSPSVSVSSLTARTAKLTKPAKVPSWARDMTMETYAKQLETWSEIDKDVPEFMKFHDFLESLKTNKEIKGLPFDV